MGVQGHSRLVQSRSRRAPGRHAVESGLPAVFPPMGLEADQKGIELAIDWTLTRRSRLAGCYLLI